MESTLTLYIAGSDALSERAVANLRRLVDSSGGIECQIVDVLERPDLARQAKVIATPLLVRVEPEPVLRIIGDLSPHARVAELLGLAKHDDSRAP